VIENVSWVVIDGIEITRQRIDQGQEMFAGGIYLYDSENVVITNCYLHDWYVASTSDGMYGGVITLFCSNVVVDACHIRGTIVTAPDKGSGAGYYGNSTVADIIKNCEIHDTSQGIFGANIVHDCHIHHIRDSFNTSQHENGVWLNPGCVFYNNIVHDLQSGTSVYPNPGYGGSAPIWVYNNLVFNTLVVPIGVDPSATSADMVMKVYIHNNTIRGDSVCVNMGLRSVGPVNTLDVRNNFFITPSTDPVTVTHPVLDLTVENNIQLSPLAAASAGFVEDAYFAPRSVESPTVDSGIDLSSFFQADLRGIARPQLKAWDIGAYEFVGISVPRTSSDRLLNRRE
jgi:hypothetical protein